MVKILHIGCSSVRLPYDDIEEVRLDINPYEQPDIVYDICELDSLEGDAYDGVWASHVLEHVYEYQMDKVLKGICHVLKKDGFLFVKVPDMKAVMREIIKNGMALDDLLYISHSGLEVRPIDIIYGHKREVERLHSYQSHKTGFDSDLLLKSLSRAGFHRNYVGVDNCEVRVLSMKSDRVHEWLKDKFFLTEKIDEQVKVL